MKAKKHLGQHFLRDQAVIAKILDEIYSHCNDQTPLLEIGPGQGILTLDLDKKYADFRAIEFDVDMVNILKESISDDRLIHNDFLKYDIKRLYPDRQLNIVGNFPYNISSQIVFKILDYVDRIPVVVGMFQKEVAQRICASPGGKVNGILSILTQAHYQAEILLEIGPEAFDPPPKVDSAVILLKRKKEYTLECDTKLLRRIVKTAYGQRRKKMRNTLKSMTNDLSDPLYQKRPEELSVEEFVIIAKNIQKEKK